MNEPGLCSVWLRYANGVDAPTDSAVAEKTTDHEEQVVIFHVVTELGEMNMVFRRGELSQALAKPNTGNEIEVAISSEEQDDD